MCFELFRFYVYTIGGFGAIQINLWIWTLQEFSRIRFVLKKKLFMDINLRKYVKKINVISVYNYIYGGQVLYANHKQTWLMECQVYSSLQIGHKVWPHMILWSIGTGQLQQITLFPNYWPSASDKLPLLFHKESSDQSTIHLHMLPSFISQGRALRKGRPGPSGVRLSR